MATQKPNAITRLWVAWLLAIALFMAGTQQAYAQALCEDLFRVDERIGNTATLKDLNLVAPEIEAKFLIPSEVAFATLQGLVGTEIILRDSQNRPMAYSFEFYRESYYEDVNHDTNELSLFNKRSGLRERLRFDKKGRKGDYDFVKASLQAKDGPIPLQGMGPAVYARNEIRGTEFRNFKKFEKNRDDLFDKKSSDAAFLFARAQSQSNKKFKPVLEIKDTRFFMRLRPKSDPTGTAPVFYVSLDRVQYQGLVGKKGKAKRLEFETEIEDLKNDTPAVVVTKLSVLQQLQSYFQSTYGLAPSPESKYESGIKLTVLP